MMTKSRSIISPLLQEKIQQALEESSCQQQANADQKTAFNFDKVKLDRLLSNKVKDVAAIDAEAENYLKNKGVKL